MSNPIDDEFIYEDADNMLLLIGRQDNGSVYISVQDREPVNLPPTVAAKVAHAILERAGLGHLIVDAGAVVDLAARLAEHDQVPRAGMTISLSTLHVVEAARRLVARDRVAALVIRP